MPTRTTNTSQQQQANRVFLGVHISTGKRGQRNKKCKSSTQQEYTQEHDTREHKKNGRKRCSCTAGHLHDPLRDKRISVVTTLRREKHQTYYFGKTQLLSKPEHRHKKKLPKPEHGTAHNHTEYTHKHTTTHVRQTAKNKLYQPQTRATRTAVSKRPPAPSPAEMLTLSHKQLLLYPLFYVLKPRPRPCLVRSRLVKNTDKTDRPRENESKNEPKNESRYA